MLSRFGHKNTFLAAFLGLVMAFTFSCTQRDKYVGIYLAQTGESSQYPEAQIELKETGRGIWRVLDDEVSFRWDVRDDRIRLHTKLGGVIIGEVKGDFLRVRLPGARSRVFRKAEEI